MHRRGHSAVFALALSALLTVAACGKDDPGAATVGGGDAPAGAVKIGAVLPLSGQTATYGEEGLAGLRIAIDEINAMEGPKIELIFKDDKGDSTETAKLVGQLIKVDKVRAVIGAISSTSSLKGGKVAQESGVPMISPASTNVEVTKNRDFVSRICFIDPVQGAVLARLALEDLGAKRAAIVVDRASDYSVGLQVAFRDVFTAGGGEIVGEESFTAGEADFSALITKITSQKPDVIFIPAYYGDAGPMLKQASDQWASIPVVAGDGVDSPDLFKLMGSYRGDIYISTHFSPDDKDPRVADFVTKYRDRFGKTPGAMAALGYDTAFALRDALMRAKSDDPAALRDAINSIKDLPGVTGTITINAERNAEKDVVILKVKGAGTEFFKRIASK